jgi:hypothetical protein
MDPKFDMHHILLIDKLSRTENFVKLKDNKRKERKARKIDMHACYSSIKAMPMRVTL